MAFPPPPLYLNVVGSGNAVPDTSATSSSTVASTMATDQHTSSSWRNLSPSVLIIVIVLSVTVIASFVLCLLLRHLNRRCLRHLSSSWRSSSASTSAANAVPIFSSRRISPQTPEAIVLDSLPSFTFSSITRRSSSSISGDCAVCLSKFEKTDRLRLLPLCCHAFHADCIDVWLSSNLTCPLCRSSIFTSDSDLMKALQSSSDVGNSFRLEIGSVSRRGTVTEPHVSGGGGGTEERSRSRSFSIGSFEYLVEEDSEVAFDNAHRRAVSENKEETTTEALEENLEVDVGGGRSWIKDYVDRISASLSSRAMSFRSSGRLFTGSSRRSEVSGVPEMDLEANRVGEEITELFRWLSGV